MNGTIAECPVCETDEYRLEVLIAIRTLERLDKDVYEQDERQDAEEVTNKIHCVVVFSNILLRWHLNDNQYKMKRQHKYFNVMISIVLTIITHYIGNKVSSRSSSSVSLSRFPLGPGVVLVITGGLCIDAGIEPLDRHTRSQPSY